MLTKHRILLEFHYQTNYYVSFSQPGDYSYDDNYTMSVDDWEDMGSPRQITVTVEPGDKLNTAS